MAPLRLGLAGGGTDVSPYCDEHGGAILNATIDLYSYCIIEPTQGGSIEFSAPDHQQILKLESSKILPTDHFFKLHAGVHNAILKRFNIEPRAFRMVTYSDAPFGSGLGSSSTMVVAIIQCFAEWLRLPLGEYEIARLAFDVERKDLALAGGKQDQYAATFGGVNFMEFYSENRVIVNPLRIKPFFLKELEMSTVLYFTGISRSSAKVIEDQSSLVSKKNEQTIQAMHLMKEEAVKIKEALLTGNMDMYVDCLRRGWLAKKQTSSAVSNEQIERTFDIALQNGALAGKVSGAGGGGFMMFVVDPRNKNRLCSALSNLEGKVTPFHFCDHGSLAWSSSTPLQQEF